MEREDFLCLRRVCAADRSRAEGFGVRVVARCSAPKRGSDLEQLMVSLKRYPDTNRVSQSRLDTNLTRYGFPLYRAKSVAAPPHSPARFRRSLVILTRSDTYVDRRVY